LGADYFALTGAQIFDGTQFHEDHAVIVQSDKIIDLIARGQLDSSIKIIDLGGGFLCPGFIDAQVNGGGGIMLNDAPIVQTMQHIAGAHRPLGTTSLLPTLISDTQSMTNRAIEATIEAIGQVEGIAGLHLEGPHLAPARKGAHQAHFMRPMTDEDVERFIHAAKQIDTLLLTVAAEQITVEQVEQLTAHHIIISIGHSDASYDQAYALFEAGARGATHLFNAMSPLTSRQPGVVGAALDHGDVWCGIIADGHHVDAASLRIALRAKLGTGGQGRLFFVSDAMALAGTKLNHFILNDRRIERHDMGAGVCSKLTLEDGTLAGSDLDMLSSVRFGVERLGLGLEQALAQATSYPAQFLQLSDRGFIVKGLRADFVHLDNELQIKASWVSGQHQASLNYSERT